jgi:hypothetical protein
MQGFCAFLADWRAWALLPSNENRPLPQKDKDQQPANIDRQHIARMRRTPLFIVRLTKTRFEPATQQTILPRGTALCPRGAQFLAKKAATDAAVALVVAEKEKKKAAEMVAKTAAKTATKIAMLVSPVRALIAVDDMNVIVDDISVIVVSPGVRRLPQRTTAAPCSFRLCACKVACAAPTNRRAETPLNCQSAACLL